MMMLSSFNKSFLFLAAAGVLFFAGPVQADLLTNIGNSLNNTLNQSVRNTQNGVINGVQASVPNQNVVASGRAVAANPTLNPQTLCSQVPAALQTKYTQVCRSFNISNPCSALPISGLIPPDKAQLVSLCNAQQSLNNMQAREAAKVTPSSGEISRQIQKQIGNIGNR